MDVLIKFTIFACNKIKASIVMSFIADKVVMDGLTYDDVLLIPAYSEVLPKTVELTTKFSRNIELKIPFVTAAMDTVTEAQSRLLARVVSVLFIRICQLKSRLVRWLL